MASAAAAVTWPLCTLSFPPKRNREPSPFKWNPLRFKIRPSAPPSLHCVPFNSRPVVALSSSSAPSSSSSSSLHRSSPSRIQRKEFINEQGDVAEGVLVKILKAIKKPLVAVVLVGFLLLHDPFAALAASGGRIGGRSFSSSSPSVSRSYSGGSSSFSLRSAPFSFGGGGLYYGPTFGIGVGAGSGFFFLMMGFAAFILLSGFLSDRTDDGSVLSATQKTTVIKLQVGLLGMARSFQKDLDRIAEVADTSTSQGLSYVLTETTLALLRHPDCCISGYTYVDVKKNIEDGEKRFNSLSIEERGKFGEETLVNVNSIKRQSTKMQRSKGFRNEYIVITILVAAEGVHKLPSINGSSDLKDALQKLGSIPASKTLAVEVLWTPQEEDDTLTERELVADYPLLRPL